MICEKCGKEFFEDWRKDRGIRKTPCRFCSRSCSNSKEQTEEMNKRRENKLRKNEKKFCVKCGIQISHKNSNGICYHCKPRKGMKTRKQQQDRQNELRSITKRELVKYKGGKCERCGYNKNLAALQFHHLDPNKKRFAIGYFGYKSIDFLKEEVDKCILLCANCHIEIHYANENYVL